MADVPPNVTQFTPITNWRHFAQFYAFFRKKIALFSQFHAQYIKLNLALLYLRKFDNMAWKSILIKPFAQQVARQISRLSKDDAAIDAQEAVFKHLILRGSKTAFGRDHHFTNIKNYNDFKNNVPIRDYEALKPYVERVKKGEKDVLWTGKPAYFAKTSGTTSGMKYIPITADSIPNHFGSAKNALFNYYAQTGKGKWLDGKQIFLSGSPELQIVNGIKNRTAIRHLKPHDSKMVKDKPTARL